MEKLFDETVGISKARPTKITDAQQEELFLELAKEAISNQYTKDDVETIANDFSRLSLYYSGFEMAKELEEKGNASYEFDGDFIDWLDGMSYRKNHVLKGNVILWVKAHQPKPQFKIGDKLLIMETLGRGADRELRKDCIIYITGIKEDEALYTIDKDPEKKGGYLFAYEAVEDKCVIAC